MPRSISTRRKAVLDMGLMSVGGTGGGQYKNLVPPLTSTSQNGYKVSASSVNPSMTQDDVVKCFDGKTKDASWGVGSDFRDLIFPTESNSNQTITVELPQPKDLRLVVAVYPSTAKYGVGAANSISVRASTDGSYYTPLNGHSSTAGVFVRNDDDVAKYKYYKISMTRLYEYIGIIELMLLGK